MSLCLVMTWKPRGEMARFLRLLPLLEQTYAGLAISLPPGADCGAVAALRRLPGAASGRLTLTVTGDWAWGRHAALRLGLAFPPSVTHLHYADLDRLLRWVETRPEEWERVAARLQQADCTVIGRTPAAYATHPQALCQTEAISNAVASHLIGRPMDFSAGSKTFSRRAAEFLLANSPPGRAMGTDAEWPILLQRAGFGVTYLTVDGLDWESADRYQEQAADAASQQRAAAIFDAQPGNWAHRVEIALEIVHCALAAAQMEIPTLFGEKNDRTTDLQSG
jgi:hypothetical protein